MFYDLNVPWKPDEADLKSTIPFLRELGYTCIALSHIASGKLETEIKCPIPVERPYSVPADLKILRRCTLIYSDPSQNYRLPQLAKAYDILAVRPINEKSLQQACLTVDCDLISLDLSARFDYHFKMKTFAQAIERGVLIEICYGPGLASTDSFVRRSLISNVTQLIRVTRGRGIVISSEANNAIGCRSPSDIINLAVIWGLGPERGQEALSKLARAVVVSASLKRTSYRGAVDVISTGVTSKMVEKDLPKHGPTKLGHEGGDIESIHNAIPLSEVSKREQKRQAKRRRLDISQQAP